MKWTAASLATLASSRLATKESFGAESGLASLVDFAREGSPRKAQQLLQQFAKNTLSKSEEVDDVTKQKLKEIGAQLTNNTWMALEQSHRRDQDLINKHWRAIQECGDKHIAHLQQDVDGFEVQQVRTHEADMIMCRGLPNHTNPHHTGLLQQPAHANNGANGHVGTDQTLASGATIDYEAPDTDLPDNYDTVGWLKDTPFAIYKQEDGSYQRYFTHVSKMYTHEGGRFFGRSLLHVKNEVCDKCGALDAFQIGRASCRERV